MLIARVWVVHCSARTQHTYKVVEQAIRVEQVEDVETLNLCAYL